MEVDQKVKNANKNSVINLAYYHYPLKDNQQQPLLASQFTHNHSQKYASYRARKANQKSMIAIFLNSLACHESCDFILH